MLEFLPPELQDGLRHALTRKQRHSRLHVRLNDTVFPILAMADGSIALDAEKTPRLRGNVDIYDGSRHIMQALIVASQIEDGRLICTFKRSTVVRDSQPLDYWREGPDLAGYLPPA